jgi:hypothetical protein
VEVVAGRSSALSSYLDSEIEKWGALVKSTGAKPQ